jgi:HSP20 family protein
MNIVKKSATQNASVAPWDPFRMMREMFSADAWPAGWADLAPASFNPSFELKEGAEGYTFRADLPGVNEKDVEISIQGNRISVSGKRESEQKKESEKLYVYERSYGSFSRSFTLPDDIDSDKTTAQLKDGVLTVMVPKRPGAQAKRVPLQK